MQKSIIERISGGGALSLSAICRFLANIIFIPAVRNKLISAKYYYRFKYYKLVTVDESIYKDEIVSYYIGSYKVNILKDVYVNILDDSAYVKKGTEIFLESFARNRSLIVEKKEFKTDYDKVIKLDEAVNLTFTWLHNNYWHFIFQGLDKVVEFEESGYKGKYIIRDFGFMRQLLSLMGIPDDRIVIVKPEDVLKVTRLHLLDTYVAMANPSLQKVKKRILSNIDLSDIHKYPKKIYIRRIKPYTRCVLNEDDVIDLLKRYGFYAIFPDDYSVNGQIKYFYAADVVVCPHGASSANALFMHEGSHFIECFGNRCITPCVLDIIKDNKMFYNMIAEPVKNAPPLPHIKSVDFKIDTTHLEDVIYNL